MLQLIESKLNGDEKETLELDVSIEETKNVLKILKPNKSTGEDGIISEFYITHWEQIKDDFFLLVNDTFDKKELTPGADPETLLMGGGGGGAQLWSNIFNN